MTILFRTRLLAVIFSALVISHYGCEPLDSDMSGDAQDQPADDSQATAAADTSHAKVQPKKDTTGFSARLDSIDVQMRDTREQLKGIREDLDAMRAGQTPAPAPDASGAYKTALEQFFNHQYEESAAGFRKIIDDGRPADLLSNCQYWIGECEYGLHQYPAAIASLNKVFTYPSSTKYDDAQMMLGMSYLRMNNKARAKKELRKLIEQYPESEFVPRAKKILTSI